MPSKKKKAKVKVVYEDYISSPQWIKRRKRILDRRGYRCEICREITGSPHIHHVHYERLGYEEDADLQVLCSVCHAEEHRLRPRDSLAGKWQLMAYIKTLTNAEASRRFPKCYVGHGYIPWSRDTEKPQSEPESISADGLTWKPAIRPRVSMSRFEVIQAADYKCYACTKIIRIDAFHVVDGSKASCGCDMADKFLENNTVKLFMAPKHIKPLMSHRRK